VSRWQPAQGSGHQRLRPEGGEDQSATATGILAKRLLALNGVLALVCLAAPLGIWFGRTGGG
jgi:hypothetical protein